MNTRPLHPPAVPAVPASAPKPQPGTGTRLTSSPQGFAYSANGGGGASFAHPFKPAIGALRISFARGLVDVYEPTIKGVPIGGPREGGAPPVLMLDPAIANKAGESWCCLEVTPNAQGKVDAQSKIEIVHTAEPISGDAAIGRGRGGTVCMILWRDRKPYQVHEVLYFNVRYQRLKVGNGPAEHLFF